VAGEAGGAAALLPTGQVLLAGGFDSPVGSALRASQMLNLPPLAPRSVSATPGNGSATVSWAPPVPNGPDPVTSYTVTASTGQQVVVPDARTTLGVGGLTNGRAVTFTVRATSASGTSAASAPSAAVTPAAPDTTAPTLKISGLKSKLKLKSFLKAVSATVTPSESSSLAVDLLASARKASIAKAYNLVLATKSYGRAGKRKIKLKPSRKLVGKARKFTVRLRIVATDAAGNRRTVTKTIKVSR
jgi:hypothetical protein